MSPTHQLGIVATAVVALLPIGSTNSAANEEPNGFTQLRSRDAIPAVHKPVFVPAADASIPPHAWVMGVVVDDKARAYSLDLLNKHQLVNDRSRYHHFAVIWSPMANAATIIQRRYGNRTLLFEPTGGMIRGAPIIRDQQTGSYWSLMSGEAVSGTLKGRKLNQLLIGRRVLWRDWIAEHPETVVLAVDGVTHWYSGAYTNYFASDRGFAGLVAEDARLKTKAPIFAFRLHAEAHAVSHETIAGGKVFDVGGSSVFVYRRPGAPAGESSTAFIGDAFEQEGDRWIERQSKCRFDEKGRRFIGRRCPRPVEGFDTFWYSWSLTNPKTTLLW